MSPRASYTLGFQSNRRTLPSPGEIAQFESHQEYPLIPLSTEALNGSKKSLVSSSATYEDSEQWMLPPAAKNSNLRLGPYRRFNWGILLPALTTSLITAGFASAFLVWLLSQRVDAADNKAFRRALVAAVGRPISASNFPLIGQIFGVDRGGEDRTTMYGLALSSVASHLVSLTTPFVLRVFAYSLDSMWIEQQTRGRDGSLPTPTQYGHLVGLCASFSLSSVYDAGKYLALGRKKRPSAPMALVAAFSAALVALLINYVLSLSDLWLHATATTFGHTFQTTIPSASLPPLGTKINTALCPGPIQFIGNYATLLPKTFPSGVQNMVFRTLGMEATCTPITDCQQGGTLTQTNTTHFLLCPSFTPPFTINSTSDAMSTLNQFDITKKSFIFQSGTSTRPAVSVGPECLSQSAGYFLNTTLNPAGVLVALYWESNVLDFPTELPGWYGFAQAPVYFISYMSLNATAATFNNLLARNVSQGILGFAAPLTERLNSTSGEALNSIRVSRYPLGPLCAVLALAYGYALPTLTAGITTFALRSRGVISQSAEHHKPKTIWEIELVYLRLTRRHFQRKRWREKVRAGFVQSADGVNGYEEYDNTHVVRHTGRRFKVDAVDNLQEECRRRTYMA
ncbi:hypothetical protein C8J57DRAFT_1639961 [Mycena rebaudengoi]|nr:hypothetical protein C8J57DRAFT_1639961 [Mycena rebaudengoi]